MLGVLLDIAPARDPERIRFAATAANGEFGFATYVSNEAGGCFERHCIVFFGSATVSVEKISGFTEDRIFDLLELPTTVAAK